MVWATHVLGITKDLRCAALVAAATLHHLRHLQRLEGTLFSHQGLTAGIMLQFALDRSLSAFPVATIFTSTTLTCIPLAFPPKDAAPLAGQSWIVMILEKQWLVEARLSWLPHCRSKCMGIHHEPCLRTVSGPWEETSLSSLLVQLIPMLLLP